MTIFSTFIILGVDINEQWLHIKNILISIIGEKVKEGNFHTTVTNANEGIGFSKKGECCSWVTDKIKYKINNININHRE